MTDEVLHYLLIPGVQQNAKGSAVKELVKDGFMEADDTNGHIPQATVDKGAEETGYLPTPPTERDFGLEAIQGGSPAVQEIEANSSSGNVDYLLGGRPSEEQQQLSSQEKAKPTDNANHADSNRGAQIDRTHQQPMPAASIPRPDTVNAQEEFGSDHEDEEEEENLTNDNAALEDRLKSAPKLLHQYSKYIRLMEDRISDIEKKLHKIEGTEEGLANAAAKLKPQTKRCSISKLRFAEWSEFKTRYCEDEQVHAIDVLIGPERYSYHWRQDKFNWETGGALSAGIRETKRSEDPGLSEMPGRIRINSRPLLATLADVCYEDIEENSLIIRRPYKLLLYHDSKIRDRHKMLKAKWCDYDNSQSSAAAACENNPHDSHAKVGKERKQQSVEALVNSLEAMKHMDCLIEFMDTYLAPAVKRIKDKIKETRKVHFQDLWFVYELGDLLHWPPKEIIDESKPAKEQSKRFQTALKLYHMTGGEPYFGTNRNNDVQPQLKDRISPLELHCYFIDYDGTQYGVVRVEVSIKPYEGERDITSLDVYPVRLLSSGAQEEICRPLREQGKRFKDSLQRKHMFFSGSTFTSNPRGSSHDPVTSARYHSEIIIDFEASDCWTYRDLISRIKHLEADVQTEDPSPFEEDYPVKVWKNHEKRQIVECEICLSDPVYDDAVIDDAMSRVYIREDKFLEDIAARYWKERTTKQDITIVDNCLLPERIVGYVLRERCFASMSVHDLHPIEGDGRPLEDLILPEGHKEMIQALVKSHRSERTSHKHVSGDVLDQDVVQGKGKGLIILLHGVPGVGKTSTAECVAKATGRALFPVTCGHLGTTPDDIEYRLRRMFRLAQRWNCVLLLDEADVFLSQRTKRDMQHNAMVSVFLRVLEYYSGILFLTTNRIGSFDEAFTSRIPIKLYYPNLTASQSGQIWKMNLRRLDNIDERRVKDQELEPDGEPPVPRLRFNENEILQFGTDHYDRHKAHMGGWNGRQIRNAFQTAYALALHEAASKGKEPVLKPRHFKKVAIATLEFDQYLQATQRKDASRAAYGRGDRADHFQPNGFSDPYQQAQYPTTPMDRGYGGGPAPQHPSNRGFQHSPSPSLEPHRTPNAPDVTYEAQNSSHRSSMPRTPDLRQRVTRSPTTAQYRDDFGYGRGVDFGGVQRYGNDDDDSDES